MVAVVVPQLVVAAVVEFAVVVVAVAAVEYLAVVATYQDVGVTEVDVVAHQLDVAAVVDVVQVEGVATGVAAAVAEPATAVIAEFAQLLAVHDNMVAGVVAETFVEEVTSCVVVVEGLHDVVAAAVAAVVVVDAENVVEPFAAEQEALVKELAFDVEEK